MDHLPLIDLRAAPEELAQGIGEACRAHGVFSAATANVVQPRKAR